MKIHKTLGVAALIVAWSIGSETAPAFTTTQDDNLAVVTTLAPVFLTPTSATPLRQLPQGMVVRVVSADGEWSRIEFNDLQLGRRIGFIRTRDLRTNAATPSAMIPLPRPGPPSRESNAVSRNGMAPNSQDAAHYRSAALLHELRLTSEVTGCRDDLATLAKVVGEASSSAEEGVEAEGELEDIKDELGDAVANEGRNCNGVGDRSYLCSEAREAVRTLQGKFAAADRKMREGAIELAEAVDEARRRMASTVSDCNAAVGNPDPIPGVRDHNQAICRVFIRMRDLERSPQLLKGKSTMLDVCLKPQSGFSAEECRICAAR